MHLSPEELTDYAEGARDPADAPHLQSCDICRHQVASLRKTMSVLVGASSMNVPDPSPLFWDHLSQRVHEAVAAEQTRDERRATGLGRLVGLAKASSLASLVSLVRSSRAWAMAGVAAAITISIYVTAPRNVAPTPEGRDQAVAASVPLEPFGAADDPSLTLFADLTTEMDPQTIADTEWSSHAGAVDEIVTSLTEAERLELRRLLNQELAKS